MANDDTDTIDIETPSPAAKKSHAVLTHFKCTDMMQQHFECKLCGWKTVGTSARRKLCHILGVASGECRLCPKQVDVPLEIREALLAGLAELDAMASRKKKRKASRKTATSKLSLPKRQRLLTFTGKEDKDRIDMMYARMLIMSAVKANFMDSSFTLDFFESTFNYSPPSRKVVMGQLLDELYADTQKKVLSYMNFKNPDSFVTITMDGWQSPTGEHIRNYMWVTDEATFFFRATNAGATRPTAENIGQECIEVIDDTGPDNTAAVTSDNASAETTSWDTIRDRHEKVLATGCGCHAGSLLFKDVCQHAWAAKIIKKAVTLAKFFKHHQYCNAEIRTRTAAAHDGQSYAIILHGATRFAGSYYTMKRLAFLRTIMREISASAGFEERRFADAADISTILNDVTFWADMEKLRLFMKPLKCFIKLLDHGCNVTHHVYPGMYQVNQLWHTNMPGVPSAFQKHALKEIKHRWEWLTFPVHYISYGLSPNYHDDNIFANTKVMAGLKEVIRFFAPEEAYHQAIREFTHFKNHHSDDLYTRDEGGTIIMGMAPKAWWQLHGAQWPTLQPIAIRIFSVGTSSSASERNFSTWSHVWSNRANSLSFERACKIVYVYTNLRQLEKLNSGEAHKNHVESTWLATEIEE
jgi:hypothetical protein